MTKAQEYRDLDADELETRLTNSQKELFNLRFQAATGRLDNSARLSVVRREIARALTVKREREIEEAEALEASGQEARR